MWALQHDSSVIPPDKKWHLTSDYLRVPTAISGVEPYGLIHNSPCRMKKAVIMDHRHTEGGWRTFWMDWQPSPVWCQLYLHPCTASMLVLVNSCLSRVSLILCSLYFTATSSVCFTLPCALTPSFHFPFSSDSQSLPALTLLLRPPKLRMKKMRFTPLLKVWLTWARNFPYMKVKVYRFGVFSLFIYALTCWVNLLIFLPCFLSSCIPL